MGQRYISDDTVAYLLEYVLAIHDMEDGIDNYADNVARTISAHTPNWRAIRIAHTAWLNDEAYPGRASKPK